MDRKTCLTTACVLVSPFGRNFFWYEEVEKMKLLSKQRNWERPPLLLCILNSEGGMREPYIELPRKLVVLQNPCKPTKECICSHGKLTVRVTLECGLSKLLHITQDGLATNTQWSCWCVFFKVMVLYKVGITSLFAWRYRRFLWNAPVQGGPIWQGVSLVWWDAVFCSFVLYPWAAMIITPGNAMPQGYYLWGKNKLGGALVVYEV